MDISHYSSTDNNRYYFCYSDIDQCKYINLAQNSSTKQSKYNGCNLVVRFSNLDSRINLDRPSFEWLDRSMHDSGPINYYRSNRVFEDRRINNISHF